MIKKLLDYYNTFLNKYIYKNIYKVIPLSNSIVFFYQSTCPSWSKGLDLRSSIFGCVGSNPTVDN
jgi:hypothetical protein